MKTVKWAAAAESISTAANATSLAFTLKPNTVGVSVQVALTGTPTGTVKLQASNNGVQWDDVDDLTLAVVAAVGQDLWLASSAFFNQVRLVWTGSGTGALSGTINEKQSS